MAAPKPRRTLVQVLPPKKKIVVPNLEGTLHAHRCPTCETRYEDNCSAPHDDPSCACCRHGTPPSIWRTNRLPQPCCMEASRLATKDESTAHRLGGRSIWWICDRCKRTHPHEPKVSTTS